VEQKEYKEDFVTFDMKKEEKYNWLLLILSLIVVLSLFYFKNSTAFFISIIVSAFVIIFKEWVMKNILTKI
jgi:4-hydroxybenzoate polyprenyltransferase